MRNEKSLFGNEEKEEETKFEEVLCALRIETVVTCPHCKRGIKIVMKEGVVEIEERKKEL